MVHILDLYSGMGGLSLGFALALKDAEIMGLDIDKDAVETYNLNLNRLGARAIVQDVTKWKPSGEYDIVIAGSPCQPFSLANSKNPGEKHPLFSTFPRFFDVVLELKPKAFLLENVKGLTMRKYRHLLEQQLARVSRDYVVEWRILNAVYYGVPQRRERLFIIGVRRDLGLKPLFPEATHSEEEKVGLDGRRLHKWLTLGEAIRDLLVVPPAVGGSASSTVLTPAESPQGLRFMTLGEEQVEKNRRETIAIPLIPNHVTTFLDPDKAWLSDWGSRVMRLEKPAFTITEKHRSGQLVPIPNTSPTTYRRLTVRECMRLQSFPDWWRFPDRISISKRYKLVGEAVPPVLAYRLAVAVAEALGLETREPPKHEEWQLPYFKRAFADYFGDGR